VWITLKTLIVRGQGKCPSFGLAFVSRRTQATREDNLRRKSAASKGTHELAQKGIKQVQAGARNRPARVGTGPIFWGRLLHLLHDHTCHTAGSVKSLQAHTHTHAHTESHTISRRSLSLSQQIVHSVSAATIRLRRIVHSCILAAILWPCSQDSQR